MAQEARRHWVRQAPRVMLAAMPTESLRSSPMMAHLMDALNSGKDVGHYGRLVFAIVARYFMSADEVVAWLLKNPEISREDAAGLMHQIETHGYSPPTRRRVLEWQGHQDFPICPNPGDPDGCNVYRDLVFPDEVYERIEEYHFQKVRASTGTNHPEHSGREMSR